VVLDRRPDGRDHNVEGNTNGSGSRTGGSVMEHYRSTASLVGYGVINFASTAPAPAPEPEPPEDDVPPVRLIKTKNDPKVYVTDWQTRRHVETPEDREQIQFATGCGDPIIVSDSHMADIKVV
jgi:hypothetical protein